MLGIHKYRHLVTNAGAWIVKTPVALFVVMAGVMIDSAVRLFLTFSSSYFRLIDIPEATFGVKSRLDADGFTPGETMAEGLGEVLDFLLNRR